MSDDDDLGLVDFDVLSEWMDAQGLPTGPIENAQPLAGGTQNLLVRFTRGGRDFVLRRPPRHLRKRSNDVIRREMQVLDALAGTDVPHPGFIAGCPDETVMHGAVFYLMEPIDGFNPTVSLPDLHRGDENVRHAMGLNAADAIARLGAVDHVAVGLGDVGNPEGFLERQAQRWVDELESYHQLDGYSGSDLPNVEWVAEWLEANLPPNWSPGIIHGDYHLANLMYRFDGPDVAAIVDWEMCTIGDPLLDLGWLIATGANAGAGGAFGGLGGMPTTDELVGAYGKRSTRDLSHIQWYCVLACFKLGIVLEGTNARAQAGQAPKATGDMLHMMATGLLTQARNFAEPQ